MGRGHRKLEVFVLADDLYFISIALGSASEVRYLLGLSVRLQLLESATCAPLVERYDQLVRALQKLIDALE